MFKSLRTTGRYNNYYNFLNILTVDFFDNILLLNVRDILYSSVSKIEEIFCNMLNNIKCEIRMVFTKKEACDQFIRLNIIIPMARNWSTDQLNEMRQREENPIRKKYYEMALFEQSKALINKTKQLIASCK